MKKITKAVIPAAGLGTRFLPITKSFPKEMLPIIDTPNIHYLIQEAVKSGIEEVIIIISKDKEKIKDYFNHDLKLENFLKKNNKLKELEMVKKISSLVKITFIYQDEPKGLGHAILCAEKAVGKDDFAVLLGDDLVDFDLIPATKELLDNYYKFNNSSQLGCNKVSKEYLKKYGVVTPKDKIDSCFEITDIIEKPQDVSLAPSNVATVGRYVLTNGIFDALRKTKAGVGGEIQLTDGIKLLLQKEKVYATIFSGKRYDVGDKFGYVEAIIDYALKSDDLKDRLKDYIKDLKI